ncbi:MAG TPA: hypothetical protein VNU21_01100 [Usitatibacter sp.]|nr:hypothetical protein [Usitatibacter sp.]
MAFPLQEMAALAAPGVLLPGMLTHVGADAPISPAQAIDAKVVCFIKPSPQGL